jgi:cell division protein FtsB
MKKVVFFVIIIISIFIINNFFHSIYRLWQKQDLLTEVKNDLSEQKKERQKLTKQLEAVENPAFVEEEARNKLFLVKPGEQVMLLPKSRDVATSRVHRSGKPVPPWVQWYRLFF